jgi:16S rRNA (uracil1498-N3)-methyltransferase
MSLLRVPVQALKVGVVELEPAASKYVSRVNRSGVGDAVLLFDPEERLEADAVVVGVDRRSVRCEVKAVRPASLVADRPLWMLQGVSKGERFDQVVRDATALGATDIVPVAFARCDVTLSEGSEARRKRWTRISIEASRQCGRGDAATIHPFMELTGAMRLVPTDALRLCFWERAVRPMRELCDAVTHAPSVAIMVGPEGGLEEAEVELAREACFHPVSIGRFILRTETAATAALGAIRAMGG